MMIFDLSDPQAVGEDWVDGTRDWMAHVEAIMEEEDERANRSRNIRIRVAQLPVSRKLPTHNV